MIQLGPAHRMPGTVRLLLVLLASPRCAALLFGPQPSLSDSYSYTYGDSAPPQPPTPPLPPANPGEEPVVCRNACDFGSDGTCDDGGHGSEYQGCTPCDDCDDCGPRAVSVCSAQQAVSICLNTCSYGKDGVCDDGGPGAEFMECGQCEDCDDCGACSGGYSYGQGHQPSVQPDSAAADDDDDSAGPAKVIAHGQHDHGGDSEGGVTTAVLVPLFTLVALVLCVVAIRRRHTPPIFRLRARIVHALGGRMPSTRGPMHRRHEDRAPLTAVPLGAVPTFPSDSTCSINHICSMDLAASMGIGMPPEARGNVQGANGNARGAPHLETELGVVQPTW